MDKNYYNNVSDFSLQRGGYYPEKIRFFKNNLASTRRNLNRDLRILDVACNDGYLGKIYSQYGTVSGVDLNEEAVRKARESGVNAIAGDIFKIDSIFNKDKFDVVIAGDIIEHVFDTELLLKKIYHILDINGVVLISTPNLVSLGRRIMSVLGKNPYCEYSAKSNGINVGHIRYYTFANIKTQLQEVGFRHVRMEADTANLPILTIDKLVTALFPELGREILVKAYKL